MAEIIQFPSQPKPEHKPENPASAEVIPLLDEATAIECVTSIDILTDDIIKSEGMSPEDLAERLRQIDDHLNTLYRFRNPIALPPRAMVKTIAMLHQQSLPPEAIMQYPFITASLGTVRDHFARHQAEMQEAGRSPFPLYELYDQHAAKIITAINEHQSPTPPSA